MNNKKRAAKKALLITLASVLLGWLIFLAALYVNLRITIAEEPLFDNPAEAEIITSNTYLTQYIIFLSILVIAVGSLVSKRLLLASRANGWKENKFSHAVEYFVSTIIIVSLALAVFAAITTFFSGFYEAADPTAATHRVLATYVPIALYTVLVVSVLLAGFIFTKTPAQSDTRVAPTEINVHHLGQTIGDQGGAPAPNTENKLTGLAFSLPIITVAIALIFGLIVYDLTRTSLEVWVWVIIQTFIAVGIVAGILLSAKALRARIAKGLGTGGAAYGAGVLGLILTIIFSVSVSGMALGYGASAVDSLSSRNYISLNVYSNAESWEASELGEKMPREDNQIYVYGYDLAKGTEATLALETKTISDPQILITKKVSAAGMLNIDTSIPADLENGDYSLKVVATDMLSKQQNVELKFSATSESFVFPETAYADVQAPQTVLIPITLSWIIKEVLPAFILLMLVLVTLYLTITIRNRED